MKQNGSWVHHDPPQEQPQAEHRTGRLPRGCSQGDEAMNALCVKKYSERPTVRAQFAGGPWHGDEYVGRFLPHEFRRPRWSGFYRLTNGFYQYFTVEDCPDCEGGVCEIQVDERRCPILGGSYEPVMRSVGCNECGGSGHVEIPDE